MLRNDIAGAGSASPLRDGPTLNFIHGAVERWQDVAAECGREISLDSLASRIQLGREIWIVQAFYMLRQRGFPVILTGSLMSDAINILHCDDLDPDGDMWRYFVVTVRADRDPAFVSQLEIVQNRSSVWSSNDVYIPHWPQPGLIPRHSARDCRVENLVYMGKEDNLAPEFRTEGFREALAGLGIKLIVQKRDWWDYSEADVVLAVRGGYPLYLAAKPASKLVNGWLAGCPVIVGAESGYRELRRSSLDFIEVARPADVLDALARLNESPGLYREMVLNGRDRAAEYTREAIADRWVEAARGPISAAFQRWTHHSCYDQRMRYRWHINRFRRRIWGTQVSQEHRPGVVRAWLRPIRRTLVLPMYNRYWLGAP